MAGGASVGGVCYSDLQLAAQEWCGRYGGPTSQGVVSCYRPSVQGTDVDGQTVVAAFQIITTTGDGNQIYPEAQIYGTIPPCTPLTMDDGMLLGWAMAAVFLAVFGMKFLQRALVLARDGE